ncbi:MAG: PDZ domain-containing protein [Actinomycetota bacterium]|nr:PDZ domain-containing protein [Actinomycetota bacterium]
MENNVGVPPDPPQGIAPVRGPRGLRWAIFLAIVLVVVATSTWIPVPPFAIYAPGPVRSVEGLIRIDDTTTYSSEGRLLLTTVNVDLDITLREWIVALFDPDQAIVLREDVTGGGSTKELLQRQRAEMAASKQHAEEVALAALGIAEPTGKGAQIEGTVDGAPASGRLKRDDVILEINDQEVDTTCDVGRAIDNIEVGEKVELTIERGGKRHVVTLETERNPQDPSTSYIGVFMEEIRYRFDPGFDVQIETDEIAGPSAGLMFALALYDRLTPDDLTHGRDIAGTGTITCDGSVGPIGGIEQKVAAAEARGAEIFLAPAANATAAEGAGDEIEVVSISNFDDAVEYLEGLE